MKKSVFALIPAALLALSAVKSHGQVTTTFGDIPGNPGSNPYSGSGIPTGNSEVTTIGGLGAGGSDTITLAMSATQHGSGNPAPGNNGAGTFYVNTGQVGGRSVWNFDFYISDSSGSLADDSFVLVETANGQTYSFNPLTYIPDNVGGPGAAGNSESLDFPEFGVPIDYNASQNDDYDFTLEAYQGSTLLGSDSITVQSGIGAVPEANTVTAGELMLLPLGFSVLRSIRRRSAKV